MDTTAILNVISPILSERGLFLVGIKISRDNDITITLESKASVMTLDDCEAVNRAVTDNFSQDDEDYSLTVTSAGLDGEFKVREQFDKALGSKVDLWLKGGGRQCGVLESADENGVIVDGVFHAKNEVNKVKYHIEF